MNSKKVWNLYWEIVKKFDNEFDVLLKVSREEFLDKGINEKIVDLILKNREGKIEVRPGYDGVYGEAFVLEKDK